MQSLTQAHDELIKSVAAEHARLKPYQLTTFFPVKGKESTNELMVVGRAVNGWSDMKWLPAEANDENFRKSVLDDAIRRSCRTDCCPMAWVNDSNRSWAKGKWAANRSAFFRLSRSIYQQLFGVTEDWPSRLIFSNLYKVAPAEGGNPGARLCKAQQQSAEQHLQAEIDYWKPKNLLLITDWNWAKPFVEALQRKKGERLNGQVEWRGEIHGSDGTLTKAVVCVRPERRNEADLVRDIQESW